MNQKEYKQLSCRALGSDCDFLVRSEKEDEAMSLVSEHACRIHKKCELTPEGKDKMQGAVKNICCAEEGRCYGAPRMTGQSCWDAL